MRYYLGSPGNQLQAHAARDQTVLVSFAVWQKFKPLSDWMPSFKSVLLDSGAYSELNSGKVINLDDYLAWRADFPWADAWAGLDDISGNFSRSLRNYERGGFPTIHNTDPDGALEDLIPIARERGGWLGVGLKPPRTNCDLWLYETLPKIPDDLHVHGFAMGAYTHHERIDSIDSTHWWNEAMKYRTRMPWLTYGETLEIAVKKTVRVPRMVVKSDQMRLFGE